MICLFASMCMKPGASTCRDAVCLQLAISDIISFEPMLERLAAFVYASTRREKLCQGIRLASSFLEALNHSIYALGYRHAAYDHTCERERKIDAALIADLHNTSHTLWLRGYNSYKHTPRGLPCSQGWPVGIVIACFIQRLGF